jgi:hypothetical protein
MTCEYRTLRRFCLIVLSPRRRAWAQSNARPVEVCLTPLAFEIPFKSIPLSFPPPAFPEAFPLSHPCQPSHPASAGVCQPEDSSAGPLSACLRGAPRGCTLGWTLGRRGARGVAAGGGHGGRATGVGRKMPFGILIRRAPSWSRWRDGCRGSRGFPGTRCTRCSG